MKCQQNLAYRAHFRHHNLGILGARIAGRAQQSDFAKADGPKFIQESPALLGAGNSGKPVGIVGNGLGRQRFAQDNFRSKDRATGADHPRQLGEDRGTRRV